MKATLPTSILFQDSSEHTPCRLTSTLAWYCNKVSPLSELVYNYLFCAPSIINPQILCDSNGWNAHLIWHSVVFSNVTLMWDHWSKKKHGLILQWQASLQLVWRGAQGSPWACQSNPAVWLPWACRSLSSTLCSGIATCNSHTFYPSLTSNTPYR